MFYINFGCAQLCIWDISSEQKYKKVYLIIGILSNVISLGYFNEYYGAAEPPVRCGESYLLIVTQPE